MEKIRAIEEEVVELERLITEWSGSDDPEVCWAIYLLEKCLEKRLEWLRTYMH